MLLLTLYLVKIKSNMTENPHVPDPKADCVFFDMVDSSVSSKAVTCGHAAIAKSLVSSDIITSRPGESWMLLSPVSLPH